ncbi:MAG: hypothetical protein F6K30_21320 [Cyanothece sp. SIO2G6]|nr:hypothetical protein [Cyanothece sp. SIO2G6]
MTSFFRSWSTTALPPKKSIVLAILPNILLLGGLGLIVSLLFHQGIPIAIAFPSYIFEFLLGLLLIFWVHAAYRRFLEGQHYWSTLVNTVRNLAHQIWLAVAEKEAKDRQRKVEAIQWLAAFVIMTPLYLRRHPLPSLRNAPNNVQSFLSAEQYQSLSQLHNPPLEVAFWLGEYLQLQHQRERLPLTQLAAMRCQLDTLVAVLGDSDRLVASSFSATYIVYLRQMLWLYCLLLPFQIVATAGWMTAPIVMVVGAIVLGTEAIGRVLEHPFHPHPHALPLDTHSEMVVNEITILLNRTPRSPQQTSIKIAVVPE